MGIPGLVEIGADEVGIVRKKIGSGLPSGKHIALNGEAGYQADILPPGMHFKYFSWLYEVRIEKAINIPQGETGLVVAKDGMQISPASGRILGRIVDCHDFQDARAFLENGGEKGRQLGILTAGTYSINTELFTVIMSANATQHNMKPEELRVYKVDSDKIGIVTTNDGQPRPDNEIAGSVIPGHNKFQDAQKFVDRGGCKGLQEETLPAGSWNLNPWFVEIEQVPLTKIPTGTVGVVISKVGKTSNQPSDHLVERDYKGIWKTTLGTGEYPMNTRVMEVVIVPTHDITLNWSDEKKHASNYDADLRALKVYAQDGFSFSIEVTQVIRIPEASAPKMISRIVSEGTRVSELAFEGFSSNQKFSSIRNLVTRVLEPTVCAHFLNSAQDYKSLAFHINRRERLTEAEDHIKPALKKYGVEAVGTYIKKIDLPDEIQQSLKEHELSKLKVQNLRMEKSVQEERQSVTRAEAIADMQPRLVESELGVEIAGYEARQEVLRAQGVAESIRARLSAEIEALGGFPNYLARLRVENLPRIQLPRVLINSRGDRNDLLDAVFAPMLDSSTSQPPLLNPSISSSQPKLPPASSTALPQASASLCCPIVLLLDTSASMSREYVDRLVQGIQTFEEELAKDDTACRCVEVAIIALGDSARVVQAFNNAGNFSLHHFDLAGTVAMGQGIQIALKIIENRKNFYSSRNIEYCQPWVILIAGSTPSDHWQMAAQQIKQAVAAQQLVFLAVAVQDAIMDILSQMLFAEVSPTKLEDLKFEPLFYWLAQQMKKITSYQEKERLLEGLATAIEQAKTTLSQEQAEPLVEYAARLMAEVSKENPERKNYSQHAARLLSAAKDVGKDGQPIIDLVPSITNTLKFS